MVSSLGFVSMLAFGGILLNAGQVVAVIMDDVLNRKKLRTSPLTVVVFWASVTTGWIFAIGKITRSWWNDRLEDFEYEWWDSVWFAYISTTTVGLGDFFLQPEVIFLPDVVNFSLLFLTGFVFISTFLDKLIALFGRYFPNVSEDLKARVGRTKIFYTDLDEEVLEDRTAVDALSNLVENSPEGIRDLSILQEEDKLLRKLLERNAEELKSLLEQNGRERKDLLEESALVSQHIDFAASIITSANIDQP
jgi:hypothetical protein